MVPWTHPRNPFTNYFHNPSTFMAWNNWNRVLRCAGHQMPIAVTHTGRRNFYQDLSGARLSKVKRFNLERPPNFIKYGRFYFHDFSWSAMDK
jgi:hypothetical protein